MGVPDFFILLRSRVINKNVKCKMGQTYVQNLAANPEKFVCLTVLERCTLKVQNNIIEQYRIYDVKVKLT